MKKLLLFLGIGLFLISCGNSNKPNNSESEVSMEKTDSIGTQDIVDPDHTARTSLDYYGEYEGVLPCADCQGIKVKLTLAKDDTYVLDTQYQKEGAAKVEPLTGKFSWNSDKANTIILNDVKENYRQFFVAEGRLFVLDTEGNRIDGNLAEHYILTQTKTY